MDTHPNSGSAILQSIGQTKRKKTHPLGQTKTNILRTGTSQHSMGDQNKDKENEQAIIREHKYLVTVDKTLYKAITNPCRTPVADGVRKQFRVPLQLNLLSKSKYITQSSKYQHREYHNQPPKADWHQEFSTEIDIIPMIGYCRKQD